ncbi:hypothetical protein NC99_02480 [Sunxiuqinia dokdonensis]|uniref:Uncharacterized protein n=1 Tax=Sunxiuqinia dokdonensis TaxID=1409788 RepID=A0A0L8VER1_9BACT|nr:hypothetical protein NC99_02480 [Sunxiuqinia dokdonensis]
MKHGVVFNPNDCKLLTVSKMGAQLTIFNWYGKFFHLVSFILFLL